MAPQKLIVFKHQSALGNAPAHKLFERVRVEQKQELRSKAQAPRSFADYHVTVNKELLPTGVELLELL